MDEIIDWTCAWLGLELTPWQRSVIKAKLACTNVLELAREYAAAGDEDARCFLQQFALESARPTRAAVGQHVES